MKKVLLLVITVLLLTAGMAAAAEDWLTIGGDYRFRVDSLKGTVPDFNNGAVTVPGTTIKDNTLLTNRLGLNLKADPVEDVVFKARLVMYKVWGSETSNPAFGGFFADRVFNMDGTSTHVPQDNTLRVDYLFATINNIFDQPIWFSIGRRPSTGGIPSNLRYNQEKLGTAGIPSILVDYAFDGLTLGYAPDIAALPGFYGKFCYGRGFSEGFDHTVNNVGTGNPITISPSTIRNTEFFGLNVVPYDTDKLHIEVQYNTGRHIFDNPNTPSIDLGNIDWLGGVVMTKAGNLNLFASAAASKTEPNDNLAFNGAAPRFAGLEWDLLHAKQKNNGYGVYVGGRYDIPSTKTKIGLEYNYGSKYWISMVPASDDIWTGKLGTRGSVYEAYIIQELNRKPIAKKGKAFIRVGYQYYKFDYTLSNSWIGSPVSMSDVTTNPQGLVPLKDAQDLYATFEVQF